MRTKGYVLILLACIVFGYLAGCAWMAPKSEGGGGGGDFISEAGKTLPFPWNVVAGGVGTLCTIGGGAYLKRRGDSAIGALETVVSGVAAHGSPVLDEKIRSLSIVRNTEKFLKPFVQGVKRASISRSDRSAGTAGVPVSIDSGGKTA